MFAGEITINTFFNFLNFFSLCAIGGYLFKKHLWPTIAQSIAEQQEALFLLSQKKDEWENHKRRVEKEGVQQRRQIVSLGEKVQLWHAHFVKRLQSKQEEQGHIKSDLLVKRTEQKRHVAFSQVRRRVVPGVVKGAREQLKVKFSSEKEGAHFLKAMIDHMSRGGA